jgi:hypothetical protein
MTDDVPFALFLSWTCYGTWLPGDLRGYVSNTRHSTGGFTAKQNIPGTPYTADDPFAHKRAHVFQKGKSVRLTFREARWAAESFVAAAAKRGWRILRGAIMANHVHLVVCDCPDDGPAVQRIFKGVSQADLSKRRVEDSAGGRAAEATGIFIPTRQFKERSDTSRSRNISWLKLSICKSSFRSGPGSIEPLRA